MVCQPHYLYGELLKAETTKLLKIKICLENKYNLEYSCVFVFDSDIFKFNI